jgi:hypothetical protein
MVKEWAQVPGRGKTLVYISNGLLQKSILPFVWYGRETLFLTPKEVHNVGI